MSSSGSHTPVLLTTRAPDEGARCKRWREDEGARKPFCGGVWRRDIGGERFNFFFVDNLWSRIKLWMLLIWKGQEKIFFPSLVKANEAFLYFRLSKSLHMTVRSLMAFVHLFFHGVVYFYFIPFPSSPSSPCPFPFSAMHIPSYTLPTTS